ncbi:MAG: hypothetical protein ACI4S0_12415 [Dorea sp.]
MESTVLVKRTDKIFTIPIAIQEKAGQKIYNRLEELCGGEIFTNQICALTDEQIRGTGTFNIKVEIRYIANANTDGTFDFVIMQRLSDEEDIANLTKSEELEIGQ